MPNLPPPSAATSPLCRVAYWIHARLFAFGLGLICGDKIGDQEVEMSKKVVVTRKPKVASPGKESEFSNCGSGDYLGDIEVTDAFF